MVRILFHIRSDLLSSAKMFDLDPMEKTHENFGSYVTSRGEFRSIGTNAHLPG